MLDCFRSAVKESPSKFTIDMTAFRDLPDSYQSALIASLSEAWQAGKNFPWDELLNYLLKLVEPETFWVEDKLKNHLNGHREWVVGSIADLIRQGCEDDRHTFDQSLIPLAEKVLLILISRSPWSSSDVKTLVMTVASSIKEKIFYALIATSLRRARLGKTTSAPRWSPEVKEAFTNRLDRTVEPSLDFSVSLGKYLPQLHYLDKDWVKEKLGQIFPSGDEVHWKAAMSGYLLSPTQQIYQPVYTLLRENGLYTKAIGTKFEYDRTEELLAQHICVGYLADWEKLDDPNSLVSLLVDANNVMQMEAVVRFFHFSDEGTAKPAESKVRPLWKALAQALSGQVSKLQYGRILAQLANWLPLITQIDDEALSWLKLSARAMSAEPANNYLLIPHLSKRSKDSPSQVAEILLEILDAGVYPDFKQEEIVGIVEDLYLLGQKESANKICNMYGAKGYDFLKETFRKHNKPDANEAGK